MNQPAPQNKYVLALNSRIESGRVAPLYMVGLVVVAVVMVLLPVIYMLMIAGVGFLVYLHATENISIITGSGGGIMKLLIYLGPMVVGAIIIYFMIRPVFAAAEHATNVTRIERQEEPVLFAFVERICRCIGAPLPKQINVDCEVNASASFRRGPLSFFGNDLVLTIGVPLVKGLTLREFAGVLAHEFGHFTQGAAMRFSYVIRSVNFWFARVVAAKDRLDADLKSTAKKTDIRLAVVLHVSRFFVFLTSQILWGLVMFGHMISSFMLRQMEFDADQYEIKLAGSDAFASTMMQLQILSVAAQIGLNEAQQIWREGSLPDDLAELTLKCVDKIPGDVRKEIEKSLKEQETRWSDTHPSAKERIARAKVENTEGIFTVDAPALVVFEDFERVCRAATQAHYEWILGGKERVGQLISTDDAMAETEARQKDAELLERFFLGTVSSLRPFRIHGSQVGKTREELIKTLRTTREQMAAGARAVVDRQRKYGETTKRKIESRAAKTFLRANLELEPGALGLKEPTTEEADRNYSVATVELKQLSSEFDDYQAIVSRRIGAAFRLLQDPAVHSRIEEHDDLVSSQTILTSTLNAMGRVLDQNRQIKEELIVMRILAGLQGNEDQSGVVDAAKNCTREVLGQTISALKILSEEPYPFRRDKDITVGRFLLATLPEPDDINAVHDAAGEYLDRFYVLYFRVLAKLATIAETVECALGMEPMRDAIIRSGPAEQSN